MRYIKFPKKLKRIKENPLLDFYKKCLINAGVSSNLNGVSVVAFTVHPKDYKYLKSLCAVYLKNRYPTLKKKRIAFELEMSFLDIGPVVSSKITEGFVEININRLYEDL